MELEMHFQYATLLLSSICFVVVLQHKLQNAALVAKLYKNVATLAVIDLAQHLLLQHFAAILQQMMHFLLQNCSKTDRGPVWEMHFQFHFPTTLCRQTTTQCMPMHSHTRPYIWLRITN